MEEQKENFEEKATDSPESEAVTSSETEATASESENTASSEAEATNSSESAAEETPLTDTEKEEKEKAEKLKQQQEQEKKRQQEIQEKLNQGEKFEFAAEIQKLLDILVHSLYTQKEIFIRELVSNAADALDKARFQMLTDKNLRGQDLPLEIKITADSENNLLIISDTGIGMTKNELVENIGTIAHSGSLSFIKKMAENKEAGTELNLIGQFGVGFYSVFMVADQVDIVTLSADPQEDAYVWSADGSGNYKIAKANKETRGTEIRIHIKEDAKDFLEPFRIKSVIQRYSDFVSYPIKLEDEQINKLSAIWHRSASEIKEEEYKEFFSYLTHMQDAPLAHIHLSFDAPIQFDSILFIPSSVPWDMAYDIPEKWRGIHLYARRVFIKSDCEELLPQYLRFVRGVVDSDDIPLNISRETLQENQVIAKIRKNLVRKILDKMAEMSEEKADDYHKLWTNFGKFVKQGYRSDYENREKLANLFRFNSSKCKDADELVSLKQYVDRMLEGQEKIYYLSGESRETLEKSPHLELFTKKGIEVLYLTEPVDDFLMGDLIDFQDKKLASIDQEDLDLDDIKTKDEDSSDSEEKEKVDLPEKAIDDLLAYIKDTLKDRVLDVRVSKRLLGSPCCLVSSKDAPNVGMQKIFKMMNEQYEMPKRVMELNPSHPFVRRMAKIYAETPKDEMLSLACHQLLDNALIMEGSPLDTRGMVPRIQEIMDRMARLLTTESEAAPAEEAKAKAAPAEEAQTEAEQEEKKDDSVS